MDFNPSSMSRVMVRATNWLGDAVMSLPAIRALRDALPHVHLAVVAKPWVAGLYAREKSIDQVLPYTAKTFREKRAFAVGLRKEHFDAAILLQNAFDAALMAWMAGIPERIGYLRDGRGLLLTRGIDVPEPGEIPRHERFYYLEMLRRAGILERYPSTPAIQLDGADAARKSGARRLRELGISHSPVGVSPGAAYGNAKRWLPDRFAEAAVRLAGAHAASVLIFGSASERPLCESVVERVRAAGVDASNLAGETSLVEFIDLAAACRIFLTNDSGAMHVVSALGAPVATIFGATDDTTTGPTGAWSRVIRAHAECSPCLLRECPIDHRCMTRVTTDRVFDVAQELWKESEPAWIPEARS